MPDPRPKLPSINAIGRNGEFTCKIEVIVVEQAHQRIFIDPTTGVTIATIAASQSAPPPAPHSPRIEIERVLEFDIRRFGIKHSDVDLRAFRALVELLGEDRPEGLRIVDLNGGSGEVALALCRQDSYDTVTTLVSELFTGELLELIYDNLGELAGSRIQVSSDDACELADIVQDEFDIVVVDSASEPERLQVLLEKWVPLLAPGGVIAGTFQTNERLNVVKVFFKDINIQAFGASAWMVTKEDIDNRTVPAEEARTYE